nr:MAG TPA: hypothetical protein [Caudoviricetes sp.]
MITNATLVVSAVKGAQGFPFVPVLLFLGKKAVPFPDKL